MASGAGKKKAEIAIVLLSLVIPYLYMAFIGTGTALLKEKFKCERQYEENFSTLDPTLSEDDLWFKAFQYCDKKHRDDSVLPFGLGSMNQNFSGYLAFFMVIGLPLFIGLWKWGRKPLAEFLE